MKGNGLLKWLTIPAALLVVFLGFKLLSKPEGPPHVDGSSAVALTPEESKALRVDADTPRDTVATLVAQVKALRGELKSAFEENSKQKTENERLRIREGAIDQRIQSALTAEREQWRKEQEQSSDQQRKAQTVLDELNRRVDHLSGKAPDAADLPIGLGLEPEDSPTTATRVHWVEPADALASRGKVSAKTVAAEAKDAFPIQFGEAQTQPDSAAQEVSDPPRTKRRRPGSEGDVKPVYTVSDNATLVGSIAMTALIGRIPIDGTVTDPYPFKVLVGADNLIANGFELPELAGAVMSGTASGDWTLSCVRGQIRSITFVFHDGTERTISSASHNGGNADRTMQGGLGWISDPYGIPCVSGTQYSNAQQYLTTQMLLTAAGAGAASLIDSGNGDLAVVSGRTGTTLGTVGITGNDALQRVLAGGVQEMTQWVNKLYGQAYAAIFVPPGAPVAVHIETPLEIDLDPHGRKVHHHLGEPHASDLD